MLDPLFRKLVEVHPERICEGAWKHLLPVPHPRHFKQTVEVRRSIRMLLGWRPRSKPILPTTASDGCISLDELMRQICAKHKLTRNDVVSQSRNPRPVMARHEFCYRAAVETLQSYPKIGRFLANRDHTTVMNSIGAWARKNDLPMPRGINPARFAVGKKPAEARAHV